MVVEGHQEEGLRGSHCGRVRDVLQLGDVVCAQGDPGHQVLENTYTERHFKTLVVQYTFCTCLIANKMGQCLAMIMKVTFHRKKIAIVSRKT